MKNDAPLKENEEVNNDSSLFKIIKRALTFIGFAATIYFVYKGYKMGLFSDEQVLSDFLTRVGPAGPIILIMIHILRTITKIIPASILLPVGVLIFGEVKGFIYNFIGSILGSLILFMLSRKYGAKLVTKIIGTKKYNKMLTYLEDNGKFKTILTIVLILPLAPADTFCLIAGLSEIDFKDFSIRLILTKPISIYFYTKALLYGYSSIIPIIKSKFLN